MLLLQDNPAQPFLAGGREVEPVVGAPAFLADEPDTGDDVAGSDAIAAE